MAIGDYEIIGRAATLLRAVPEPGWQAIERGVLAAVRATPRGGWPLDVVDPAPGSAPGVLRVTDLVLTHLLSVALRGERDVVVLDVAAHGEDGVLQEVLLEVSCRYLADVAGVAQRLRARCAAVVADVLGRDAEVPIGVTVTDVHR